MPTHALGKRALVVALVLSLLLLADSFAVVPPDAALAAEDADSGTEAAVGAEAVLAEDAQEAFVCTSGFGDRHSRTGMSLHGVTLTSGGALAVGFARRPGTVDGGRRAAALFNPSGQWSRTSPGSPGREDGLVAVTAGPGKDAWAVGFMTVVRRVMPLAMRWNGRTWKVDRPRAKGALPSMFTDVAVLSGGDPFAVGYRMSADGRRQPIAARKIGRRWAYLDPGTRRRESISLTGIAHDGTGGIWVVGHGGRGAAIGPVIYRRDDGRWQRMRVPRPKDEAVLADVVASSDGDAWAVGYQRRDGRSTPFVLRWDGAAWQRTTAPVFESSDVTLTAASVAPTGGIWVVGAAWHAETRSHEAVAAWWDGQAWNEVEGSAGGTELHDVVGSLDADGWAVGRDGRLGSTTRVCIPPQAGTFGGSEPSAPAPPVDGLAVDPSTGAGSSGSGDAQLVADPDTPDDVDVAEPALADGDQPDPAERATGSSGPAASGKTTVSRKQRRSRSNRTRRRSAGPAPLPSPTRNSKLVARDVAARVGIAENINTYGAVVADFDGDGIDDLYIGRHGRPGRLLLNRGGKFVQHAPMSFPPIDRHGCTAADIDGSGLPDLHCAIGGKGGSGFKSNELWIDPGGPAPYDIAAESGLADPTGRGRDSVFLEARRQDDVNLVVTNSPTRVDGLPSIGRLYRTLGDSDFRARARTGFASRLGSVTMQDADYDGDGREDLLLVTGGLQAPARQGTRLYRNTKRGLVDVTRRLGIRSFGEVDAKLVDIDGDSMLDLVQLSPTRLRVSVFKGGRFREAYLRSLTHGRAVGAGDINADGRDDLYIVRGDHGRNSADIMLINQADGRRFSSMVIPQASSGDAAEAVAIDHDGNGRDDFVVLNGRNTRGPIQLIAFFKR